MAKRRRDESPERQALREMVSGYLKENPVKNGYRPTPDLCVIR